ncbi:hypothetical protein SPRG_10429 [Saprolegnia parasitica CBS 223.65]|uniref:Uncharacterized protein n=1 Tax=Saprolegnia parasitica (strain CBS 223.65) TaxID=695850 RepID=A0A067CC05_SAPPC|nr:hypothetical protein SPRG_10429 [Saprolegnia parasitica CBS 223.65]KDO24352.1 hypothetical protein SPRG_10429 [Saprolegnia parasitica CBS 223.65]|eukprot:XP_012204947.1 hypothetical protein SPRG_10429 [Saprolegnia parasitica CBS 223.65]
MVEGDRFVAASHPRWDAAATLAWVRGQPGYVAAQAARTDTTLLAHWYYEARLARPRDESDDGVSTSCYEARYTCQPHALRDVSPLATVPFDHRQGLIDESLVFKTMCKGCVVHVVCSRRQSELAIGLDNFSGVATEDVDSFQRTLADLLDPARKQSLSSLVQWLHARR